MDFWSVCCLFYRYPRPDNASHLVLLSPKLHCFHLERNRSFPQLVSKWAMLLHWMDSIAEMGNQNLSNQFTSEFILVVLGLFLYLSLPRVVFVSSCPCRFHFRGDLVPQDRLLMGFRIRIISKASYSNPMIG